MNLKELTPKTTAKLNKVMESRFGFSIDYANLTYAKAQRLNYALSEQLNSIRKSYGIHTAERNAKYLEMLMVQEGLSAWLDQQDQILTEGELETAEVVLAAKDMVDSVQKMIQDASKMLNEQLPPLVDTVRDQVGVEQGEAYKNATAPALQALLDNLNAAREALDSAARVLAGEQAPVSDMGLGTAPAATDDLMSPDLSDFDSDEGDGFDATDAAAGGSEETGRERR